MGIAVSDVTALALLLSLAACSGDPAAGAQRPPAPRNDEDAGTGPNCASCGGCEEYLTVASRQHVAGPVDYPDQPPVGGPHNQCWGTWGVHDTELTTERWVHNLEHGGVVLLYRCDAGCVSDVERLKAFVAAHPRTLLTPYAKLPMRFAAVAWEYRLVSDCVDDAALQRFYDAHYDRGPESIASDPSTVCLERPDL